MAAGLASRLAASGQQDSQRQQCGVVQFGGYHGTLLDKRRVLPGNNAGLFNAN
jgi:hypothetical protein